MKGKHTVGASLGPGVREDLSWKGYMNRDLNLMMKQSQDNVWEECCKKRRTWRTSSAKALGQEHAWCEGIAKRHVYGTVSEQEDKDGRELLGPDPVMLSSESTLSGQI